MADLPLPYWAVRKTRYGRVAFDVVEVVKVTAKTHEFREQDHRGGVWGRPTRTMDPAEYPATFASCTDAGQAAQRANAAWDAHEAALEAAKAAVSAISTQRRTDALAAMRAVAA